MITRLFTDRAGGVSKGRFASLNLGMHVGDDPADVTRNRSILESGTAPILFMNQVHGDTVIVIEGRSNLSITADAMVTLESGIALSVLVADCVPILLWDEESSCIAAVHAGRRGLVNGIVLRTIEVMRQLGATKIAAEFGPSICGKCYEVGEDVFDDVVAAHPLARSSQTLFEFALDLPAALEYGLTRLDVPVQRSTVCTFESQEYFSYRRDGSTGRSAGVIWQ